MAVRRALALPSSWCLTRLARVRLRVAKAHRRVMWVQELRGTRGRMVRVMRMLQKLRALRLGLRRRVLEALKRMWRLLRVLPRRRLARRATRRLLCRARRRVHW